MSVALVCVVSGERYERFARDMFSSAFEFFGPDSVVAHIALPGREGWPAATLYRYHVLLEHWYIFEGFDDVFLIDADMRFEAPVGRDILAPLVATEHPGYAGRKHYDLPFEDNIASSAYTIPRNGDRYYAGGFVGGLRTHFRNVVESIVYGIDSDDANGVTATWHDESHLNRCLQNERPWVVLPPSYCMPDDASRYNLQDYQRILVALDKTPAERGFR